MNMYQLFKALNILRNIDINILSLLEHNLKNYKYVPVKIISKRLGISEDEVGEILKHLRGYGLIKVKKSPYFGVALEPYGLDVISLHYLKVKNQIKGLIGNIGVGKESYVIKGITPSNMLIAVKIFRLGFPSFKSVVRSRYIMPIDANWYLLSIESAKREFNNLVKVWNAKVNVPKPVSISNNIVLLEYIDGVLLSELDKYLITNDLVDSVIDNVIKISKIGKIVHGDLSAYNIIIDKNDFKPYIIDWGQAISIRAKHAPEFLRRDIFTICSFFNELEDIYVNPDEVLRKIMV